MRSILDRTWWERPYVDLWTVPHTLLGVLAADAVLRFGIDTVIGLIAVGIVAGLWELFEWKTGISKIEMQTNSVTDVIVALFGYGAGLLAFPTLAGPVANAAVWASLGLFAVTVALGWTAYRRHRDDR